MTTSNTITKTDLTNILNEILPVPPHTAQIGQVTAFAGSTAPEGWLMCDGSAVSRTTYAKLFAVIGTTYGTGDGSTTFNLPDMRNRFPVGAGSTYSLNSKGGSSTVTLQTTNLPAHTHALFGNDYPGSSDPTSSSIINRYATSGYTDLPYSIRPTQTVTTANVGKSSSVGSGTAHENLPPYIGLNFIIYTGTDFPPFEPDCAIYVSTSDPTSADGNNGDIWIKYTASS